MFQWQVQFEMKESFCPFYTIIAAINPILRVVKLTAKKYHTYGVLSEAVEQILILIIAAVLRLYQEGPAMLARTDSFPGNYSLPKALVAAKE